MLIAVDGCLAEPVGDGVGLHAQQNMTATFQPHAVPDKFGHHAPVVVGPSGDGQPLVSLDEPTHGDLTMGLQWPELASKVHEMVGLFGLEFGFKRRIDAVDGLPVDFRRPSVRENVKRAAKSCRLEKGSELFTSLLHGFLNDVAGGISQLSLERRPVRQGFQQFCTGEGHLCVVHRVLDLLVDVAFELFDRPPQLVLDPSDLINGRRIPEHGHRFREARKRHESVAKPLQRRIHRQPIGVHGVDNAAQDVQGSSIVREPVDGSLGKDEGFFGRRAQHQPSVRRLHGGTGPKPGHGFEHGVVLPRFLFGGLEDTTEFLEVVQGFGRHHHALVAFLLFLEATEMAPCFAL